MAAIVAYPNAPHSHALPSQPASIPLTNAHLNLSVLRRHNPQIRDILSIAPYAVIYVFSPSAQTWEKNGIEGTMFVCSLTSDNQPTNLAERYNVTVLNRRGLDNFSLELKREEDVEITPEYVILQGSPDAGRGGQPADAEQDDETLQEQRRIIYGLWIFAEPPPSSTSQMREVNAKLIQDCATRAEASGRVVLALQQHHPQQQQRSGRGSMRDMLGGLDGVLEAEKMSRASSGYGRQGLDFGRQEAAHWQPEDQQDMDGGRVTDGRHTVQATDPRAGADILGDLFRRARQGHTGAATG